MIVLPGVGEARAVARAEAAGEEVVAVARTAEGVEEGVNATRGAKAASEADEVISSGRWKPATFGETKVYQRDDLIDPLRVDKFG